MYTEAYLTYVAKRKYCTASYKPDALEVQGKYYNMKECNTLFKCRLFPVLTSSLYMQWALLTGKHFTAIVITSLFDFADRTLGRCQW